MVSVKSSSIAIGSAQLHHAVVIRKTVIYATLFLDYVEEIFQTFLKATKAELKEAAQKLNDKSPAPVNEMLQKQPREEALKKREERRKMVTKDVPPTTPGMNINHVSLVVYNSGIFAAR